LAAQLRGVVMAGKRILTDKIREKNKEYRALHSEEIKIKRAVYNAAHKEEKKSYYEANKKETLAKQKIRYIENIDISKAYYQANKDKMKIYRESKKETLKPYFAKYRAEHKEQRSAYASIYQKANPEGKIRSESKRRALKLQSIGELSKGLSEKLFKLQLGKCPCCRLSLGKNYHMDHIMPLTKGGTNTDDNIQLLRAVCNLQKSNKHPVDFMQSRGFLL
jgi:5-methylcytosine-specific restriction endonuclease McrA